MKRRCGSALKRTSTAGSAAPGGRRGAGAARAGARAPRIGSTATASPHSSVIQPRSGSSAATARERHAASARAPRRGPSARRSPSCSAASSRRSIERGPASAVVAVDDQHVVADDADAGAGQPGERRALAGGLVAEHAPDAAAGHDPAAVEALAPEPARPSRARPARGTGARSRRRSSRRDAQRRAAARRGRASAQRPAREPQPRVIVGHLLARAARPVAGPRTSIQHRPVSRRVDEQLAASGKPGEAKAVGTGPGPLRQWSHGRQRPRTLAFDESDPKEGSGDGPHSRVQGVRAPGTDGARQRACAHADSRTRSTAVSDGFTFMGVPITNASRDRSGLLVDG